jgi:nucleoid-associated protein YgaU
MATDAPHTCPFCSEPHAERPDECFRCETPLVAWWPFEDALRQPQSAVSGAPGPLDARKVPALLSLAIAALVGAAAAGLGTRAVRVGPPSASVSRPASATVVPRSSEAVPSAVGWFPSAASSPRLSYRVQRGDSLWRIAAALTGDGRNWRTLWPERDPSAPLVVGTVLDAGPVAR